MKVLTSAGMDHLSERAGGGTPTNAFDGLVFGAGNDDPSVGDVLSNVTQRELLPSLQVADGYPRMGAVDARNGGGGPNVWTWRFERESGSPFVASNVALTNYAGGIPALSEPVGVSVKQTIAQRFDERLIVFVNAQIGEEPTVVTATETALQNRILRVDSFTARTQALQAHPVGTAVDDSLVRSNPQPGQHVWTATRQWGVDGQLLQIEHIDRFTLFVDEWDAQDARWIPLESRPRQTLECAGHVFAAPVTSDARWITDGGYNIAHTWMQPRGATEGTFRLRYEIKLCDGDVRKWTNEVCVR